MYTKRESFLIAERISLMEPDEDQPHRYDGIIDIEADEFKDGCEYAFRCDFVRGELQDITFFTENGYAYTEHKANFDLIADLFQQWDELIDIAERKAAEAYAKEDPINPYL